MFSGGFDGIWCMLTVAFIAGWLWGVFTLKMFYGRALRMAIDEMHKGYKTALAKIEKAGGTHGGGTQEQA